MLGNRNAVANIAISNLETVRKFYEGTLGLKSVDAEGEEVIVFRDGSSTLNVDRSPYARTNRATAVTWVVGDDVAGVVRVLKASTRALTRQLRPCN